jgi:SAM-dependent methyltransferase
MFTDEEKHFFDQEQALHEKKYLAGTNPRQQSGIGRDEQDWERYRRVVTSSIDSHGTFLDVGCANGLLMECVNRWATQEGHSIKPYGVDVSRKLAELARRRLPQWQDRIFVGNAFLWSAPFRFDFVRTEMVYVPHHLRQHYAERLLEEVVAPGGSLIACSYGSSSPDGGRTEALVEEFRGWGLSVAGVHDVVSPEHGFVITRVISVCK